MVRSKKELAIFLSQLKVFERPKVALEQYPSDGNVAASLLWHAAITNQFEGKKVFDMGCGTGILGIGALILGAENVEFSDIDPTIYPILKENIAFAEEYFDVSLEGLWRFSNCNVMNCAFAYDEKSMVVMNPPFGTKKKHADKAFLKAAFSRSPVVYSMHKTSTDVFIQAFCRTEDVHIPWRDDCSFPIKNTMKGHAKKIERIEVTVYMLVKNNYVQE